jgi:hypothetical protein
MVDQSNLLSTPSGYATPEQIKDMYDYAKYLGQGNAQFPVITKPTQGISNMVNALMGGWLSNRANQAQRGSTQYDVGSLPQTPQFPQQGQQVPQIPNLFNTPVTPTS